MRTTLFRRYIVTTLAVMTLVVSAQRPVNAQFYKDWDKKISSGAGKIVNSAKTEGGRLQNTIQGTLDATQKAASDFGNQHIDLSLTVEWKYRARVTDPYRLINVSIREMKFDTNRNQLTFHLTGRLPIRASGSAKIPGRMSTSLKADTNLDFDATCEADFAVHAAQITAQPRVRNIRLNTRNTRFNADLVNAVRRDVERSLRNKLNKETSRLRKKVEEAIGGMNLNYNGRAMLQQIAEQIRRQVPAQNGMVRYPGAGPQDPLTGAWQGPGRNVTFQNGHAMIQTALGGSASFSYQFDPQRGALLGTDQNGQRTETYIRWLSPNEIEWQSPSGTRRYVKIPNHNSVSHTAPSRIDLRYFGAGVGGVVEEHLKRHYANYEMSDSGKEVFRP